MPRLVQYAGLLVGLLSSVYAQSTCNGYSELCSKSYSNVTYIGAHNSYSVAAGSLAANQNFDVTTQLNNGIRMLQNQGHLQDGAIHLCHSSCLLLDAGTITAYLAKVKSWLDSNPNEVVTILWVNQQDIPAATWAAAYAANGLDALSYVPSSYPVAYSAWPTLSELISSGKRLVSFMDYGADYSSAPYILDHFTHFWENPYDQTDDSFPCTIDRGSAETPMYMVNHYLDKNMTFFGSVVPVPDTTKLEQTNAVSGHGSLGLNAQECAAEHGQYPTFVLVDFYDVGDGSVFQAAANLNGVTYKAVEIGNGTSVSTPTNSTSRTGRTVSTTSNDTDAAPSTYAVSSLAASLVFVAAAFFTLA